MSDKRPVDTPSLWQRLKRVAARLDAMATQAKAEGREEDYARWRAMANTCLQAGGRLRGYFHEYGEEFDTSRSFKSDLAYPLEEPNRRG